jgi:DNA-binding MarR family transcriptional regulator
LEAQDGLDISELSERCYLLMPSLSRIIQNLELRQLVLRASSAVDQRRSVISLSDSGRKLFDVMAPKSAERYEYITEKFGPGKLALLYELLDELMEKIDEPDS